MTGRFKEAPDLDFHACILFDEMSIKKCVVYSHTLKQVYGPHSKIQKVILVVMVRRIFSQWKQIIYF